MSRSRSRAASFREHPAPDDVARVRRLVTDVRVFEPYEVDIAVELVRECLARGPSESGYHFLLLEEAGELIGYTCYGRIGCTCDRYDIYWLVVGRGHQRAGWGKKLLSATEERIEKLGGKRIFIETSSRDDYAAPRTFYASHGYRLVAVVSDFYAEGNDKLIYSKRL